MTKDIQALRPTKNSRSRIQERIDSFFFFLLCKTENKNKETVTKTKLCKVRFIFLIFVLLALFADWLTYTKEEPCILLLVCTIVINILMIVIPIFILLYMVFQKAKSLVAQYVQLNTLVIDIFLILMLTILAFVFVGLLCILFFNESTCFVSDFILYIPPLTTTALFCFYRFPRYTKGNIVVNKGYWKTVSFHISSEFNFNNKRNTGFKKTMEDLVSEIIKEIPSLPEGKSKIVCKSFLISDDVKNEFSEQLKKNQEANSKWEVDNELEQSSYFYSFTALLISTLAYGKNLRVKPTCTLTLSRKSNKPSKKA